MKTMIETGAVCSEYAPGVTPSPQSFPRRNRLISACCEKLLVVEAGEKSGALITAQYAKEQNKEVYAVPNNIYSKESKGTNKLISEGANIYLTPRQLVTSNTVILVTVTQSRCNSQYISENEKYILAAIKNKPSTVDEIVLMLRKDKSSILDSLFLMELEGKVRCVGGRYSI